MRTGLTEPRVSVLLATHDRPALLDVAVRCFTAQRDIRAEAVIVDDSAVPAAIAPHPGIRLVRVAPGTALGEKLNIAAGLARGAFFAKWDDDDYYGPAYLRRMVALAEGSAAKVIFAQPFLFYDAWTRRLAVTDPRRCSGATLVMPRETWSAVKFRPVRAAVDADFLCDVIATADPRACRGYDIGTDFVQLRHAGHLWTHLPDGQPVREYLAGCPRADTAISDVVPAWVLDCWEQLGRSESSTR